MPAEPPDTIKYHWWNENQGKVLARGRCHVNCRRFRFRHEARWTRKQQNSNERRVSGFELRPAELLDTQRGGLTLPTESSQFCTVDLRREESGNPARLFYFENFIYKNIKTNKQKMPAELINNSYSLVFGTKKCFVDRVAKHEISPGRVTGVEGGGGVLAHGGGTGDK